MHGANLGTLLRTCDAVGACMAVPRLPWVPEALARGNTLRRRSCVHWVGADPVNWLERQRAAGTAILGVELAEGAIRLADLPAARRRTIAVLGHEQGGIPPEAFDLLDAAVEIPMIGTGHSLNVAVAGSSCCIGWPASSSFLVRRGGGDTIGVMTTELNVWALLAEGDDALTEAAFRTGDFERARGLIESARAEAASGADVAAQARSLDLLGLLLHYENITTLMGGSAVSADAVDAEERMFRQALACWQQLGEPVGAAQSLFGLGLVFQVLHSDWMTAMPYYWQALGVVSDQDAKADLYLRSEVHRHVGFYFLVEGMQPSEAERHLQISLELREELGDSRRIPSGILALGQAALESGGRDRAVELLRRAVAEARAAQLLPDRIREAERALAEAEGEGEGEGEPSSDTDVPADDAPAATDDPSTATDNAPTAADDQTQTDNASANADGTETQAGDSS